FFWEAVRNTLAISLLKLGLGFAIPIVLAIMIFEMQDGRLKKFIQTVSYIPHFFSWIVLGGMMISWLSTNGFINQVLMSVGLM
ncbi:sugar ABC transporter permease, partial [Enterococcus faecium]